MSGSSLSDASRVTQRPRPQGRGEGTVERIEWASPHARLHGEDGERVTWDFELPSPGTLMRRGWLRTALPVGAEFKVTGNPARESAHIAIVTRVAAGVCSPAARGSE